MDVTLERFRSKTRLDTHSGCLVWVGGISADGYGRFYCEGRQSPVLAHRWHWQTVRGPIPDGLEMDHLCRNRACVNLDHLEPVTRRVNAIRGVGFAGINARKTHCPQGHPYAGDNVYINAAGGRVCRTCDRAKVAAYKQRKANK